MAHEEPESMPGDGLDWLEDEDSLTEVVDEEQIQDEAANAWLAAEEAYVPIDDGNGYLAVGGAEAGSVVSALPAGSAPTGTSTAPVIAGRDDALTGDRPIYLVHRGARHANFLPIVMGDLHHKKGRSLTIGAVANLPSAKAGTTSAFFHQASVAALRIADPQCYRLDEKILRLPPTPIGKRVLEYAPYLANTEDSDWLRQVLDAQRAVGANLLLTPGRALNPDDPQSSLDATFQEADQTLALTERGERIALNLTIPSRWLAGGALRNRLLDEILDQDQFDVLYVRIQWAQTKAFAPTEDADILMGIRRLANLCEDEGRSLLLPQTGMTGWVALAHGAAGYGLGVSGSEQCFAEHAFRRGRPGQQQAQRYFEKQMLHTLDRSAHDVVKSAPGYLGCDCSYCPALFDSQPWSHPLAALHHIFAMGALTAKVHEDSTRGGRHAAVRRIVATAKRWSSGLPLGSDDVPRHLAVWDQAL
ncbi:MULTISPECIES: hypothetical protein [unclassified Streptomyces]|uniref:hypothetical protein n=1 Tax=unclassified Streptomyces TaxID=2593676 RepID=UPI0011645BDE|nr:MULTISPECIES: hypothetical protein [unclassified Streptomyces]NMI60231.1 hypothetical protein [Streptomyces sp. RLA2-12]QDN59416.1 hypothetical protein FNV67_32740 [Streptomyces sp. S1D4-20]QDN69492.1 hypothetical protein FNV66_31760 [Streptomyces sp. S1D4-14]